ncbi:hypothetical protein [Gottfriedia acidiceleris]|uniref:hypothetical protein n=1 Tax=Gottfriedia acidiceleris TaxID=371036 RepID=UPI0030004AF6
MKFFKERAKHHRLMIRLLESQLVENIERHDNCWYMDQDEVSHIQSEIIHHKKCLALYE